ncbi:MAG: hypothetical protein FWE01_02230 [Firmicutes bacterium]|nr:hypothetical protein [Bacillota bacterium]
MTQVKEEKVKLTSSDDLFVLVLVPQLSAFALDDPFELELCGKSLIDWNTEAVSSFPYRRVEVSLGDDIITLVRKHATRHKYICVVYADMPLVTRRTIEEALNFTKSFSHKAVRLPRGWLFETEYVKNFGIKQTADGQFEVGQIETVDCTILEPEDFVAVYNYSQLGLARSVMQSRINYKHMQSGVQIIDSGTAYIDAAVIIESGVVIEPNTIIKGKSSVGCGTKIGPNAHLRNGSIIGKNCKIGNFVEVKNSSIGDGSKVSHMSYIGDGIIGTNTNIGCGVVFCNYDGKKKSKTVIGDNCFIGSNVNFVSPIIIGDNVTIAAGSTITENVPSGALGIARERQIVKEDYNTVGEKKPVQLEDKKEVVLRVTEEIVEEDLDMEKVIEYPIQEQEQIEETLINDKEDYFEEVEEVKEVLSIEEEKLEEEFEDSEQEEVEDDVEVEESAEAESEEDEEESLIEQEIRSVREFRAKEKESGKALEKFVLQRIEDEHNDIVEEIVEEMDDEDSIDEETTEVVEEMESVEEVGSTEEAETEEKIEATEEVQEEEDFGQVNEEIKEETSEDEDSGDDYDDDEEGIEKYKPNATAYDWDNPDDDIEEFYQVRE